MSRGYLSRLPDARGEGEETHDEQGHDVGRGVEPEVRGRECILQADEGHAPQSDSCDRRKDQRTLICREEGQHAEQRRHDEVDPPRRRCAPQILIVSNIARHCRQHFHARHFRGKRREKDIPHRQGGEAHEDGAAGKPIWRHLAFHHVDEGVGRDGAFDAIVIDPDRVISVGGEDLITQRDAFADVQMHIAAMNIAL